MAMSQQGAVTLSACRLPAGRQALQPAQHEGRAPFRVFRVVQPQVVRQPAHERVQRAVPLFGQALQDPGGAVVVVDVFAQRLRDETALWANLVKEIAAKK